jgi:hypothetical protein
MNPSRVRLCAPVADDGTINPRFCQATRIGTCLRSTLLKMDIAVQANASGPAGEAIVSAAHDQLTR